jgi:demethylmenaquinone methyltransferase/2-methoxy-6-polyprenyl-1,4-benzoquinol methylase
MVALAEAVGPCGAIIGIDLSERMLHRSAALLARAESRGATTLVCADAACVPLPAGWADKILMTFTLELFDTPEIPLVLGECLRILRPGGRLAVASLSRPAKPRQSVRIYEWAHRRFPSFATCRPIHVEAALTGAGFTIKEVARVVAVLPIEIVIAEHPTPRSATK